MGMSQFELDSHPEAGGIEPPNGGIKISLINNVFKAHLEKC